MILDPWLNNEPTTKSSSYFWTKPYDQLVAFGRLVGAVAARYGIMITVEPLNRAETNTLNTVTEAASLVYDVNHANFRLLVDAYHWARETERADDLVAAAELLHHAHIATYPSRLPPAAEATDLSTFFLALQQAHYDKRLSVEAGWSDLAAQAPAALQELRRYVEAGRRLHVGKGLSPK